MRFKINKNDKNFVESLFNIITINSIDDIFIGAGKILKASQEWEQLYKEYCSLFDLNVKDYSHITLKAMTKKLFKSKVIDELEFEKLIEIIQLRNQFYHQYFLDNEWSSPLEEVEETLNSILYLINDSIDFIQNKIYEHKKTATAHIKTILDSNKNINKIESLKFCCK